MVVRQERVAELQKYSSSSGRLTDRVLEQSFLCIQGCEVKKILKNGEQAWVSLRSRGPGCLIFEDLQTPYTHEQETWGLDTIQATSFLGGYLSSFKKTLRQRAICKKKSWNQKSWEITGLVSFLRGIFSTGENYGICSQFSHHPENTILCAYLGHAVVLPLWFSVYLISLIVLYVTPPYQKHDCNLCLNSSGAVLRASLFYPYVWNIHFEDILDLKDIVKSLDQKLPVRNFKFSKSLIKKNSKSVS